eukprot:gene16439-37145_t
MEFAFNTRNIAENSKILEELITLRHEKALLLGYPNHAAFQTNTETRMAKSETVVRDFLKDLSVKLNPLVESDLAELMELKKRELSQRGEAFDGKLNAWDRLHYIYLLKKEKYQVDKEKLKEYFPLEVVTSGLLDIYQEMLGLKFAPAPELSTWHPDVKSFSVSDKASGDLMG